MEVSKSLNVTSEEFYKVLIDSLNEEVKLFTNDKQVVQGLKYTKPLNTKLSTTLYCDVLISKLEKNKTYEYTVINNEDKNIVRYEIEDLGDNCIIKYTEEYITNDSKKNANSKFMSFIMSFYLKRRLNKKLTLIEKSIISRR